MDLLLPFRSRSLWLKLLCTFVLYLYSYSFNSFLFPSRWCILCLMFTNSRMLVCMHTVNYPNKLNSKYKSRFLSTLAFFYLCIINSSNGNDKYYCNSFIIKLLLTNFILSALFVVLNYSCAFCVIICLFITAIVWIVSNSTPLLILRLFKDVSYWLIIILIFLRKKLIRTYNNVWPKA